MKTQKRNGLFTALMLVCLCLASMNLLAQEKELKTGSDGFQWYQLYQNGKVGAQSMSGTTFIPLSRGYTFISYHDDEGGWFTVEKNGKKGACNITGREIVAPGRYDKVDYTNDFLSEYYTVGLNGKLGICDKNGHEIIAPKYDYVISIPMGGDRYYFTVQLYGKMGVCDVNGREIIAPKYDYVCGYSERDGDYYQIELNGKKGACDVNGREIVAPKYESLVYSSKDGVFEYQNASGKWVSTGISLPKSSSTTTTTTTTSGGSSSSGSSSGSDKGKLLYEGRYRQTDIHYPYGDTYPPQFPLNEIKIYENKIEIYWVFANGADSFSDDTFSFQCIQNGKRVYTNGPITAVVGSNYNITCNASYGASYQYVKEGSSSTITMPQGGYDSSNGSNGGYNNGGGDNNGGKSGNTPTQQKQHKCGLCKGSGRTIKTDGTSFGKTKYCSECDKTVPDYHYHSPCESCGGKGWW